MGQMAEDLGDVLQKDINKLQEMGEFWAIIRFLKGRSRAYLT